MNASSTLQKQSSSSKLGSWGVSFFLLLEVSHLLSRSDKAQRRKRHATAEEACEDSSPGFCNYPFAWTTIAALRKCLRCHAWCVKQDESIVLPHEVLKHVFAGAALLPTASTDPPVWARVASDELETLEEHLENKLWQEEEAAHHSHVDAAVAAAGEVTVATSSAPAKKSKTLVLRKPPPQALLPQPFCDACKSIIWGFDLRGKKFLRVNDAAPAALLTDRVDTAWCGTLDGVFSRIKPRLSHTDQEARYIVAVSSAIVQDENREWILSFVIQALGHTPCTVDAALGTAKGISMLLRFTREAPNEAFLGKCAKALCRLAKQMSWRLSSLMPVVAEDLASGCRQLLCSSLAGHDALLNIAKFMSFIAENMDSAVQVPQAFCRCDMRDALEVASHRVEDSVVLTELQNAYKKISNLKNTSPLYPWNELNLFRKRFDVPEADKRSKKQSK